MSSLDGEGINDEVMRRAEGSSASSGPAKGGAAAAAQSEATVTSSHVTTAAETTNLTIIRPDTNSGDTPSSTSTVIGRPSTTDSQTSSTTAAPTIIQPTSNTDSLSDIYRPPPSTDAIPSSIIRPNQNDTSYPPATAFDPNTATTQPIPTPSPATIIQPPNHHTDSISIPNSDHTSSLQPSNPSGPPASRLAVPPTDSKHTDTPQNPATPLPDQSVHSTSIPPASVTSSTYLAITQRPPNQVLSSIDAFPPTFVAVAPLTTDFRPPATCASLGQFKNFVESPETSVSAPHNIFTWKYGQSCGPSSSIGADCLPFPFAQSLTKFAGTVGFATTLPVFSPADRCPQGYTGACTMVPTQNTADPKGSTLEWPALGSTQVAFGCCPRYVSGFKVLHQRLRSLTEFIQRLPVLRRRPILHFDGFPRSYCAVHRLRLCLDYHLRPHYTNKRDRLWIRSAGRVCARRSESYSTEWYLPWWLGTKFEQLEWAVHGR